MVLAESITTRVAVGEGADVSLLMIGSKLGPMSESVSPDVANPFILAVSPGRILVSALCILSCRRAVPPVPSPHPSVRYRYPFPLVELPEQPFS